MKPEDIEIFFGTTYRTWQNQRKERRPVVEFFTKYETLIETFLKQGYINQLETINYIADPAFEDYVITKLKREHHLDRNFFNYIYPGAEFLTRHLKQLQKYDLGDLTVANAKEKFVNFLSSVELLKFIDSEKKRKSVIDDIQKFANIEAYLILKYPEKFTS